MRAYITQRGERHNVVFFDEGERIGSGISTTDPIKAANYLKRTIEKYYAPFKERRSKAISSFFAHCDREVEPIDGLVFLEGCDYQVKSYAGADSKIYYRIFKTETNYATFTEAAFCHHFTQF